MSKSHKEFYKSRDGKAAGGCLERRDSTAPVRTGITARAVGRDRGRGPEGSTTPHPGRPLRQPWARRTATGMARLQRRRPNVGDREKRCPDLLTELFWKLQRGKSGEVSMPRTPGCLHRSSCQSPFLPWGSGLRLEGPGSSRLPPSPPSEGETVPASAVG